MIFSLLSFFLMVATISVGTFCDFNDKLVTSNTVNSLLDGLGLDDNVLDVLNKCIPESATGNIVEFLPANIEG